MKKMTFSLLVLVISATVNAQNNFEGWFVGGELHSTKHSISSSKPSSGYSYNEWDPKSSRKTGIGVFGGYGFSFASDWVGQAELKLRTGGSKSYTQDIKSKEILDLSISYLQGYRVAPNLLPYFKLSAGGSILDIESSRSSYSNSENEGYAATGFGIGIGVKYAITPDFEIGAEYLKSQRKVKDSDSEDIGEKIKINTLSVNGAYRF